MNKILSLDKKYFYIPQLTNSFSGGWLISDPKDSSDMDWLPFIFWKVKRGEEIKATDEDVRRYKERMAKKHAN